MSIFIWTLNIALLLVVLGVVINWLWIKISGKRLGGALTNEEFEASMRKAQIIDIREKADFKASHILGARNIPFSTFKMMYGEIRSDLPVYLYGDNVGMAIRAAKILHKNNYQEVKWLQNGFTKWEGKTKASKY